MTRALCTLAACLALAGWLRPDVDAVEFAKAFKAKQTDQYDLKQAVSGTGISFHGTIDERVAAGSIRRSLVVTLGAMSTDTGFRAINTWTDFVAAERARTTLVVALSGPDLPDVPAQPVRIQFHGVYDGQVRTIMRVPEAGASATPDSGPCPGEHSPAGSRATFYCAPLLTGATAVIVPQ